MPFARFAGLSLGLLLASTVHASGPANDAGITPVSRAPDFNQIRAVSGTGSFTGAEATMSPRFFRAGVPGEACATLSSGNFQFQEIPIRSDATGSITANFDPGATCGTGIFVTFHTGNFNPANICERYVWSFGSSAAFNETFTVPANTDMTMVVSGVANAPGVVCGPYTYSMTGANPRGSVFPPPVPRPAVVPSLGTGGMALLALVLGALGIGALMRRK
jgi:hypothetical protein